MGASDAQNGREDGRGRRVERDARRRWLLARSRVVERPSRAAQLRVARAASATALTVVRKSPRTVQAFQAAVL